MAVIAELLHRKCNAAVPHVDVGTDVFAFRDDREDVARIQVKTDGGRRYRTGDGFSARFGVPIDQLKRTDAPPLFYAFAVRLDGAWACFLLIGRAALQALWNDGLGSENDQSGDLELHIQFRWDKEAKDAVGEPTSRLTAQCGKKTTRVFDLTAYLNAWDSLPPLKPSAPIPAAEQAAGSQVDEADPGTAPA